MDAIELHVQSADSIGLHIGGGSSVPLEIGAAVYGGGMPYTGGYTVTPSTQTQTLPTENRQLSGNITVNPMPSGNVDMIGAGFDKETGAYWSKAAITQGYVSPSGQYSSSKKYLDTASGTTITPSDQEQVAVAQYRWTTGAIKVAPIPSNYGLITWNGSVITVS